MSPVISADVPEDMSDRIDEEQEEGESRSAVVRRLLRVGIDVSQSPAGVLVPWPAAVAFVGWLLVAATWVDAQPIVGVAGLVTVTFGILFSIPRVQAWMDRYNLLP